MAGVPIPNPDRGLYRRDLRALLHQALSDPVCYQVLALLYGLEDGIERTCLDTATILGLPVATVRDRHRTALELLRDREDLRDLLRAAITHRRVYGIIHPVSPE